MIFIEKCYTSVVYKIVNKVNNKFYIGSTHNFHKRLLSHISLLRRNKHYNLKLQNSWSKYGEDNFKIEIVLHVKEKDLLIQEQKYINIYKSYKDEIGFNIQKKVTPYFFKFNKKQSKVPWNKGKKLPPSWNKGLKLTQEHKKKLSESSKNRKRKPLSEETKLKISIKQKGVNGNNYGKPTNRKKVYQFDLNGNFIREYDFLKQVEQYGFSFKKVSSVALGQNKTHKKYKWSYTKNINGKS